MNELPIFNPNEAYKNLAFAIIATSVNDYVNAVVKIPRYREKVEYLGKSLSACYTSATEKALKNAKWILYNLEKDFNESILFFKNSPVFANFVTECTPDEFIAKLDERIQDGTFERINIHMWE